MQAIFSFFNRNYHDDDNPLSTVTGLFSPILDDAKLEQDLVKLFKKLKLTYLPKTFENCPYVGIQENESAVKSFEEAINHKGGFCIAWCYWFTETRILNPTMKQTNIEFGLSIATEKSFQSLFRFIIAYVKLIQYLTLYH